MVLPSQVRAVLGRTAARQHVRFSKIARDGPSGVWLGCRENRLWGGGRAEGRAAPESRPLVCGCLRALAGGKMEGVVQVPRRPSAPAGSADRLVWEEDRGLALGVYVGPSLVCALGEETSAALPVCSLFVPELPATAVPGAASPGFLHCVPSPPASASPGVHVSQGQGLSFVSFCPPLRTGHDALCTLM